MPGISFEKAARFIKSDELLPENIAKIMCRIIDAAAPYEPYAAMIDETNPDERLGLHLVLDAEGLYSEDLYADVRRVTQKRYYLVVTYTKKHRLTTYEARQKLSDRIHEVFMRCVMNPLQARGRKLAIRLMLDMVNAAWTYTIGDMVRQEGFSRTNDFIQNELSSFGANIQMMCRGIYRWHLLATEASLKPVPEMPELPYGMTQEEVMKSLRDIEFDLVSKDAVLPFTLPPHLALPGIIVTGGQMLLKTEADARMLCGFILHDADHRIMLSWAISRMTGEFILGHTQLTPLVSVFTAVGTEAHYRYLQRYCIVHLLAAIQRGEIRERAYISGGLTDRLKESLTPPPTTSESGSSPLPKTGAVLYLPGSMRLDRERGRTIVREGSLSWRRIMAALQRCGVEIDFSHAHPKLRHGGKVTSYLNPHDRDQEYNRRVLYNTLEVLGISEADFFRQL